MAIDFTPADAATPNSGGINFTPAAPPVPNTSGITDMAQANMQPPPVSENSTASTEPPPELTPEQKLHQAAGYNVTSSLAGNQQPMTPELRAHMMQAYQNGTATTPADFMQTALPAIAATTNPGFDLKHTAQEGARDLLQIGTWAHPALIAAHLFDIPLNVGSMGAQAIMEHMPADSVFHANPQDYQQNKTGTFGALFNSIGEKLFPEGAARNSTEAIADSAIQMAGAGGLVKAPTLALKAWNAFTGAAVGAGGEFSQEKAQAWAQKNFPNSPVIQDALTQAAGLLTMLGTGGALHEVPKLMDTMNTGHEVLKGPVGKAMGKDPADVTPQDINNTIAAAHTDGPKAEDFHNAGKIIDSDVLGKDTTIAETSETPSTLQKIYAETGVKPEQVYQDMKTHPWLASQVQDGKVPDAYIPPTPATEGGPSPTPKGSKGTIADNPLAKIFNPAGISDQSKDMATALRQAVGPETRDALVAQEKLKQFYPIMNKMSREDQLKFIDYYENRSSSSAKNPFPETKPLVDTMDQVYKGYADKAAGMFNDFKARRDYFTHQYTDPDAADKFIGDWIAKQGSERNLKERQFPTLADAMEAGLTPKTTNPIDTVNAYTDNMSRLLSAHKAVESAVDAGVAGYYKPGLQPKGWVELNGNLSEKAVKPENSKSGEPVVYSKLYAPEDAARVYNNDISSKATGPIGDIADGVQKFNNFTSKLVLGLSGYHFTATTMASMASDVGRALTGGTLGERASDLLSAVTPGKNTSQGSQIIDSYLGRSQLDPQMQSALDLAIKNNTVNIKQQNYWKAGPAQDYADAFSRGVNIGDEWKATLGEKPVTGVPRIIATEIGRTMDTLTKPLFDHYIPRIKISANIMELHDWMQKNPDATPEQRDTAAQEIGNSIDNRFGEMMRDNLFWHKLTQQTLQTALLSYSWVAGAARLAADAPNAVRSLPGIKDIPFVGKEGMSPNAKYLFGMAATYAVANAVTQYLHTGQGPDDIKDFIYPKTGGVTPQGQSEREILPSHIGQYTNYLHNGIGELGNEISPGLKLLYHLSANEDWRGLPITNENNSWMSKERWGDYLQYVMHEETPIGVQNFIDGSKKGTNIGWFEKLLGARAAPRFVSDPEGAEQQEKKWNDKNFRKKIHADTKVAAQLE